MKNKKKIKLIKEVIKLIKQDWNICKNDFSFACYGCYTALVIKFLEDWRKGITRGD